MAEEFPGHIKLREAVEFLGMSHMWVRRMVREGKLPHVRSEKGHIFIPIDALEEYQATAEARKQTAADRKAGLIPRQAYTPQYVKQVKSTRNMVEKMEIDEDAKETTLIVLNELLAAQVARALAAKAAKEAEATEAGETAPSEEEEPA